MPTLVTGADLRQRCLRGGITPVRLLAAVAVPHAHGAADAIRDQQLVAQPGGGARRQLFTQLGGQHMGRGRLGVVSLRTVCEYVAHPSIFHAIGHARNGGQRLAAVAWRAMRGRGGFSKIKPGGLALGERNPAFFAHRLAVQPHERHAVGIGRPPIAIGPPKSVGENVSVGGRAGQHAAGGIEQNDGMAAASGNGKAAIRRESQVDGLIGMAAQIGRPLRIDAVPRLPAAGIQHVQRRLLAHPGHELA